MHSSQDITMSTVEPRAVIVQLFQPQSVLIGSCYPLTWSRDQQLEMVETSSQMDVFVAVETMECGSEMLVTATELFSMISASRDRLERSSDIHKVAVYRPKATETERKAVRTLRKHLPLSMKVPSEVQMEVREPGNFVMTFAALFGYSVKQLSVSLFNLLANGNSRPVLGFTADLMVSTVQKILLYPDMTVEQAQQLVAQLGTLAPKPFGTTCSRITLNIDRELLLKYERDGEVWHCNSPYSDHKIPREELPGTHSLEGQWILPWSVPLHSEIAFNNGLKRIPSYLRAHNLRAGPRKVILYLHGGAYILGNYNMYTPLNGLMSRATGLPILSMNYRLAPQHPFPAAVHDAFAAYLWLIDPHNPAFGRQNPESLHAPFKPEDVIISGDSAGGGLCLSLLNYINMYLRKPNGALGVPLPGAGLLLSPWVDLSCSSQSYKENKDLDFLPAATGTIHTPISASIQHPVYSYCFGSVADSTLINKKTHAPAIMKRTDSANALEEKFIFGDTQTNIETVNEFVRHPLVSPLCGDLKDLPPLLIQAGDAEMLRDETISYAYKYCQSNNNSHTSWVRHELYVDMPHVFQVINTLPSSKLAIKQMQAFLNQVYSPLSRVHSSVNLSAADSKLIKVDDQHLQCV